MPRTVRLIDPALQPGQGRLVPVLANYGLDVYVEFGQDIEVPDEVAGEPPTWEPRTTTMLELGRGLLAQHDVWIDPALGPADVSAPRQEA